MSMPRRLIVMRHAKSSWSSGAATDHARPLNNRGQRDAPRVAKRLTEMGWAPDLILSSDSQRTRETYDAMVAGFENDVPVQFHRSMYHAGLPAIIHEAPGVPDDLNTLMVLGHNPGWEEVVQSLSDEMVILKTANAALLEGTGDTWLDALAGAWSLIDVVRAREL